MAKVISTNIEYKNFIEKVCKIAIKNACDRLLVKLQDLILSEYYDESVYEVTGKYHRTMQFYDSAMTEMLTQTCGQIFMNPDKMNYPFSGFGWSWDGATQIHAANEGSHGGWTTEESKRHRYWDEFERYCDKYAVEILKDELQKQGLKII